MVHVNNSILINSNMLPLRISRKVVATSILSIPIVLVVILLSVTLYFYYNYRNTTTFVRGEADHLAFAHCDPHSSSENWTGENTLVVFAGRWQFLRILFPYVYRELRKNGGVLDRVVFMMMNYDDSTLTSLTKVVTIANKILEDNVFEMNFMGYAPGKLPPFEKTRFSAAYYNMFSEMIVNSSNRYFKIDDDIVYIHPGTFRKMIESKNSECCFMHFGNIVSNWRCNIKHQQMGMYKSIILNPKRLLFEHKRFPNCGWHSYACAELTLKTFLVNYHQGWLESYRFNGLELLHDRQRFSIQFHMLDADLINVKKMMEAGPLGYDDESWWTETYSQKFSQPNCIVGETLLVHFSYGPTYEMLLSKSSLLGEFESLVQNEVGTQVEAELWKALG